MGADIPSLWDLGGFAVLAIAFMLVVRWMLTEFRDRLVDQTMALREMTSSMKREMRVLGALILNSHASLLSHDYSMTGLESLSAEDRLHSATKKYDEVIRQLTEVRRLLLDDPSGS